MVLNGLGFVERRLYLYPEFFLDIVGDRSLGDGVTPDHLNDDVLGRTLDAIATYGPDRTLQRDRRGVPLGQRVRHAPPPCRYHCVQRQGECDADFDVRDMTITYGHLKDGRKDGRWDLKQFVLGMATNQHAVPLFPADLL